MSYGVVVPGVVVPRVVVLGVVVPGVVVLSPLGFILDLCYICEFVLEFHFVFTSEFDLWALSSKLIYILFTQFIHKNQHMFHSTLV